MRTRTSYYERIKERAREEADGSSREHTRSDSLCESWNGTRRLLSRMFRLVKRTWLLIFEVHEIFGLQEEACASDCLAGSGSLLLLLLLQNSAEKPYRIVVAYSLSLYLW